MKYKLSYDSWDIEEKSNRKIVSSGNYSLGSEVKNSKKNLPNILGLNMLS